MAVDLPFLNLGNLISHIEKNIVRYAAGYVAKWERGRHREKLLSELTADEDILFYWSMNSGLLPKLMMEWAC